MEPRREGRQGPTVATGDGATVGSQQEAAVREQDGELGGAHPDGGAPAPSGAGADGGAPVLPPDRADLAGPALAATRRSRAAAVSAAAALVVGGSLLALPVPYVVEGPGPVVNTLGRSGGEPLITISGARTYPDRGSLDLTTVSISGGPGSSVDLVSVVRGWLDPRREAVLYDLLFAPGTTADQEQARDSADMTASQDSATVAALTELGYDVPTTITVASVSPGAPAASVLRVGDVLTGVDGSPVSTLTALRAALDDGAPGRTVTVGVRRGGEAEELSTATVAAPPGGPARVQLGVGVDVEVDPRALPVDVRIAVDRIGGPSAGMMFALGIVDRLTPGALNGGKDVAGTGTIDTTGAVGPIGGIAQKMAGASAAGASAFIAPRANCPDVVGHVPAGLRVVPVEDLSQARAAVEAVGRGETTSLDRCPGA